MISVAANSLRSSTAFDKYAKPQTCETGLLYDLWLLMEPLHANNNVHISHSAKAMLSHEQHQSAGSEPKSKVPYGRWRSPITIDAIAKQVSRISSSLLLHLITKIFGRLSFSKIWRSIQLRVGYTTWKGGLRMPNW